MQFKPGQTIRLEMSWKGYKGAASPFPDGRRDPDRVEFRVYNQLRRMIGKRVLDAEVSRVSPGEWVTFYTIPVNYWGDLHLELVGIFDSPEGEHRHPLTRTIPVEQFP